DYAVNRTYSQGQSRFTQVDPIVMASASAGDPQSNNLYAYVQNAPVDFVDPSGLLLVAPTCITYAYGKEYKFEDGTIIRVTEGTRTFCYGGGGYGGAKGVPTLGSSFGGGGSGSGNNN